jgi:isoleucyl-tRNA synthetase
MSKSLGNTVDPVDIADRLGAEIVRLWVASVDFREDVRVSEELMQRVAENYRKIRNTFRNMLANLYDFDSSRDAVELGAMRPLDQYLLLLTADLAEEVRRWYEEFGFHKVYQRINQFCVVDLSAFYFDVLKDRLYTFAPRSSSRRSAQTALWRIADALVRMLAPIMSFTAEEIWKFLPASKNLESVHLATFPMPQEIFSLSAAQADALRADWGKLLAIREPVLKALEEARQAKTIGSSLEAQLELGLPDSLLEVASRYSDHLRELFIVSGVELRPEAAENGSAAAAKVKVKVAAGRKCERCWNYSVHVGENAEYPGICERCTRALQEISVDRT